MIDREEVAHPRILEALLREMKGTSAEKLILFEKLKDAGMLFFEDPVELKLVENLLRQAAAIETTG